MARFFTLLAALAALLLPGAAHAACPPIPFIFQQGAPFNAPQVNTNFSSLRDCINSFFNLTPGATTTVANNTALKAFVGSAGTNVLRLGFTTIGDGGSASYNWQAASCAAADDGAQVQSTAGGCWVADLPKAGADVRIWGADASGIGDSTNALKAAVASAVCNIILPAGTLKISGNIPITKPCTVTGAGVGLSTINVAVATGHIFTLSGTGVYPAKSITLRDFGFTSSVTRTANAFVHCITPLCYLRNLAMRGAAIGILFDQFATSSVARDINFQNTVPASVYNKSTNILLTGNVVAVLLDNITSNIESATVNNMPRSCIEIEAAEATIISNSELIHCQSVLLIDPNQPTHSVLSTRINNSFFDSPLAPAGQEAYSFELNAIAGILARTTVSNSWFSSSQHDGIVFKIGAGLAVGFECTGCEMVVNGRYGVNINTANFTDVRFIGGAAAQNGTANFRGSVNTSDITIVGVSANDGLTASPVGVALGAGSARWRIVNNDLRNTTTAIPNAAACTTDCVITGNTGYNPVHAAAITIPASPSVVCAYSTPASVYIGGGTVSSIYVQGASGSINAAGLTSGNFGLGANECVIIEWTVAPTVIMDKH